MNKRILKFLKRSYDVGKVYSTLGLIGGLIVGFYLLVISKPFVTISVVTALVSLLMTTLLWFEAEKLLDDNSDKAPPKLPELFIVLTLPSRVQEAMIGDLRVEFKRLVKFGRKSAVAWYSIQCTRLAFRAGLFHSNLQLSHRLPSDELDKKDAANR